MDPNAAFRIAIRPLTSADIEQCVVLEGLGFPPEERCSLEKFQYRIGACPELCLGLFYREFNPPYEHGNRLNRQFAKIDGSATEVDEEDDNLDSCDLPGQSTIKSEQLIGHIIATKMGSDLVTEEAMMMPQNGSNVSESGKTLGHVETSRVIGIHSLVVHPDFRGLGYATWLYVDYMHKISQQQVADKIALLAKESLLKLYVDKLHFRDLGISKCTFGGVEWHDLVADVQGGDEDYE
ncbi:hypothetical protein BABINDRAFT_160236 [Babjeviella inositovora NRRL Y-12698]|uniref:N-acetyltransferase domain-containing protein n=1 Tax=Babjeviella inositovora NRRL Y-12698 TaxID=984486 RepID=A0A1E3QWI8_9ASCO|nr:uncharacterized protein BABINDRAFT_160236 [Babjeviella inositovora NRRL Y-12698]ODQ82026.1 hypothetical protein BABINDRAFT_160236 [Babjeviella inositovora NRRL Y-12698]